jgi:hypothetical protein
MFEEPDAINEKPSSNIILPAITGFNESLGGIGKLLTNSTFGCSTNIGNAKLEEATPIISLTTPAPDPDSDKEKSKDCVKSF